MFEEAGLAKEDVMMQLEGLLAADATYRTGHPIASMSTIPHPLGSEVFAKTLERNAGRLHTFRGSAEIENQVIGMIGNLVNCKKPIGTTTSGGTESNILAMLAFRECARNRNRKPEIIAPMNTHASVDKAAWLLGIRIVKTHIDKHYRAIPNEVSKKISKNTVGIFATAGTTYLGQIDPIEDLAEIAESHQVPLHVDAAFGGFVIPFLRDLGLCDDKFDFELKGVTSLSTDAHKMGLAPIPSGCLIFSQEEYLRAITREIPYLRGASSRQSSLLGTRPAASIIATWAIMKRLGRAGYREIVSSCMEVTNHIAERIRQNLLVNLSIEPVMNIIGIESKKISLESIVEQMEDRAWRTATSPNPPSIRLVVMPHVTKESSTAFLNDLDEVTNSILNG